MRVVETVAGDAMHETDSAPATTSVSHSVVGLSGGGGVTCGATNVGTLAAVTPIPNSNSFVLTSSSSCSTPTLSASSVSCSNSGGSNNIASNANSVVSQSLMTSVANANASNSSLPAASVAAPVAVPVVSQTLSRPTTPHKSELNAVLPHLRMYI